MILSNIFVLMLINLGCFIGSAGIMAIDRSAVISRVFSSILLIVCMLIFVSQFIWHGMVIFGNISFYKRFLEKIRMSTSSRNGWYIIAYVINAQLGLSAGAFLLWVLDFSLLRNQHWKNMNDPNTWIVWQRSIFQGSCIIGNSAHVDYHPVSVQSQIFVSISILFMIGSLIIVFEAICHIVHKQRKKLKEGYLKQNDDTLLPTTITEEKPFIFKQSMFDQLKNPPFKVYSVHNKKM